MQIQFIKSSDFGRIKKNDQKTTFCAYLILLRTCFLSVAPSYVLSTVRRKCPRLYITTFVENTICFQNMLWY